MIKNFTSKVFILFAIFSLCSCAKENPNATSVEINVMADDSHLSRMILDNYQVKWTKDDVIGVFGNTKDANVKFNNKLASGVSSTNTTFYGKLLNPSATLLAYYPYS